MGRFTSNGSPSAEPSGSAPEGAKAPLVRRGLKYPFALVTALFALWGFANDVTNPMVAAFQDVLLLSNFKSSLVQFAFYGGYCVMAIPAALFIMRFAYKAGILLGLGLYATGCCLFIPAGGAMSFAGFLAAYFIMTCGLSFLETTANPYVLSMGDETTATRRLNLAQAFNPMGSLLGMFVAKDVILARLHGMDESERRALAENDPEAWHAIQAEEIDIIAGPYLALGAVVAAALVVFAVSRLPVTAAEVTGSLGFRPTLRRLMGNGRYVGGVIAQTFYVGAQITCWTFIIQYGVSEVGLTKAQAQGYNIAAMVLFASSRFICTFLLRFVSAPHLLAGLAGGGGALVSGAIFLPGHAGLLSLVAVSGCMSLMFPTIYGLALHGLGEDAKLGSAGLILAIGGGSVLPPLQGAIMDSQVPEALSSVRLSFAVPLTSFAVIGAYAAWRVAARRRSPA